MMPSPQMALGGKWWKSILPVLPGGHDSLSSRLKVVLLNKGDLSRSYHFC